jgi:phenylacetic acid degradation protein PaaD
MTEIIERIKVDPYACFLGITIDHVGSGSATCSLVIREHLFNFLGVVHGGLIFSLADVAFSAASNGDHLPSYALDVSGSFLKSPKLGDVIRAEAERVHTTKRTGVYRMQVYNNKELIAVFNGTVFRSSHRTEKTEPADMTNSWTEPISGIEFVKILAGNYSMGDFTEEGLGDELPVHEVHIDTFYLAVTPVTRRQWKAVMGRETGPSALNPDCPATDMTYEDIGAFLEALNMGSDASRRFLLPTEAEWEYAARSGGKNEPYPGSNDPHSVAWFGENSEGRPRPVAQKKPNGLGLYDMAGNVWEWCRDTYQENAYKLHERSNPVCLGESSSDRVARGGSWLMDAWSLRCTRRFSFPVSASGNGLGFRPAMYTA